MIIAQANMLDWEIFYKFKKRTPVRQTPVRIYIWENVADDLSEQGEERDQFADDQEHDDHGKRMVQWLLDCQEDWNDCKEIVIRKEKKMKRLMKKFHF